jgi:hypothetical protein
MLFLVGVIQFVCGGGFANKRESPTYDSDTTGKDKSGRQTTAALGIKRRRRCCFWRGSYIFCCEYDMLFLAGVIHFLCVWGSASKKEICTYNSVYYLCRGKTTKNALNIMFFWENVSVPLYRCVLSFVEIQHQLFFQNNMAIFVFCITLCMTGYAKR